MKFSLLIMLTMVSFGAASQARIVSPFEIEEYNRVTESSLYAIGKEDFEGGMENLIKAAEMGNKIAQFTLGLLYLDGKGIEQDFTQAYLWIHVAAEAKEKEWRATRDKLRSALTEEQVASLEPFVEKYINTYGEDAQQVSCAKRARTGSSIKVMQCIKIVTRR